MFLKVCQDHVYHLVHTHVDKSYTPLRQLQVTMLNKHIQLFSLYDLCGISITQYTKQVTG